MFEAVLFDLDGTLIDSEPWHKKSELEIYNSLGANLAIEDLYPFTGNTLPRLLSGLGELTGITLTEDEFRTRSQSLLGEYVKTKIEPFEDAARAIDLCSHLPCAVVTSSMRWYFEAVRIRHGCLFESMRATVVGDDVKFGKPDPEPYLMAAEMLCVDPRKCLVIEDSLNGVRSGMAAGCTTWHVHRGHEPILESHRFGATLDELFAGWN